MRNTVIVFIVVTALATTSALAETPAELTERLLGAGKLAEADSTLDATIKGGTGDDTARFGLGVTRLLRAVERLSQSLQRFGIQRGGLLMANVFPFTELPIPANAHPEPIRYSDLRKIVQAFVDDLASVESTLGAIGQNEVKLPLHFGRIRLDLDGDGRASPEERLWKIYLMINGRGLGNVSPERCEEFAITFDRGDVAWLRGYCHFLMALAECYLAHDGQELFDYSAALFFQNPVTRFPFLVRRSDDQRPDFETAILDVVAMIHSIRLPILQPERMRAALEHLEAMIALSRESWRFILAETDDDHEWVPNPRQNSVLPNGRVNDDMIKAWMTFLDESEAILKGNRLVPFWRRGDERGVNLRRVFTEPRPFDLVLWVQGTAATPYLEKGPVTSVETWRRLQRVFSGQFIGFAFWFN